MKRYLHLPLFCAAALIAACTAGPYLREDVASHLASPAWMVQREIPAGAFDLKVAERMHTRFKSADIYIEGDGYTDKNFWEKSENPTPRNPVALHLATRDLADNVAWLARPCQYTTIYKKGRPCAARYWRQSRFAPEVIDSYNIALDEIKKRYDIEGFHLIGFDGGGTIAALLAARRADVLSLRTVAGILDTEVYARNHGLPRLEGVNPATLTSQLGQLPQAHWAGGQDIIVPPAVLQSYLQAMGDNSCIKHTFVQEAGHEEGWVNKWPDFLKDLPTCRSYSQPDYAPAPYEPDLPLYPVSREIPDKP